jgi:hypothetical protein
VDQNPTMAPLAQDPGSEARRSGRAGLG